MKFWNCVLIALVMIVGISCQKTSEKVETNGSNNAQVSELPQKNLVRKPDNWINERVQKAKEKLTATEAGTLVWQSMEAHGGLEQWFKNGALSFRFDYLPIGDGTARRTIQQIDTWSNRAVHQDVLDQEDKFGWNGENAWVKRNDTLNFPYNVRFWALTPYYFLGQPFLFDGEGVILEKLDDVTLYDSRFDVVKISFESGTGDAPDDYYINYYDKQSHLLKAITYIVSYPGYFKEEEHSPEKIMVVNDYATVENIVLPSSYTTYKYDVENKIIGEKVTEVEVSDISFIKDLPNEYFETPEGAEVIEDL